MLVLTRKENESVRIDDDIEVTVLEIRHNKVRLGFRCPETKVILRTEVWERQQSEAVSVELSAVERCMAG